MSNTLPAPKIETVQISLLKPWDKNPRRGHAVAGIARSIETFGYLNPIIVQAGTYRILAGHGRFEALRRRGVDQVPVIVVEISDEKADLYTIADNKLGEISAWDTEVLAELVRVLRGLDINLDVTGFSERELQQLLDAHLEDPAGGQDDVVEPEAPAISAAGDLWELRDHRVFCGDSTQESSYREVLGAGRADLVFTDPPYGVDYKAKKFDLIKNDELKGDKLLAFLSEAFAWSAFNANEDAAFYIWHASSTREDFAAAMKMAGLIERQYLIWAKPSIVLGHADYQWQHEPCFYAHKQGGSVRFFGDRSQATVWTIGTKEDFKLRYQVAGGLVVSDGKRELYIASGPPKGRKMRRVRLNAGQVLELSPELGSTDCWTVSRDAGAEHPTQKPVELSQRAIMNSSQPEETVLDPFLGSGSTLIGCEVTGRKCAGIELSPNYVDVIVRRWQRLTGQKARNLTRPEIVMG